MKFQKIMIAAAASLAMASSAFADTTVTFTAPAGSLNGTSLNGFTFNGNWVVNGSDARLAPYMEMYDQQHSISYDAGSFNFAAISLGGWPWDNYGGGSNNVVTMVFKDINGATIDTDTLAAPLSNAFASFTKNIAGVHEITFLALGGTQPDGSWVTGSWPRLDSVTIAGAAPAVPEPESYALALAGLLVVGAVARRRQAAQ